MRLQAGWGAPGAPARPLRPRLLVCRANYRWSAEEGSSRKRESLYGYDDNGEPRTGDVAAPADGAGADASPADAWQQWQGNSAEQQTIEAWDAAAANVPRRQRRVSALAADGGREGRLSRRRQQRLEQQQQQQQPEVAAPEGDPWAEAELRQMRRRGRAAARGNGAAAGPAAPLPDPWAQEWGPLQGATAAAAAEDFGWAAESWARGSDSPSARPTRQQQQWDEAAAGAGAGSSWSLQQEQREMRRRRRRAGRLDDGEDAAASGAGAPRSGGDDRYAAQRDLASELEDLDAGLEGEGYDDATGDDGVPPGSATWRGAAGTYSDAYEPGVTAEPDIALLSSDELDRVLPAIPSSQQASFFSGSATDGLQRWGASLALTVLFSKVALLAGTSLTWPLWWPWALAARKNIAVRRPPYRYGGLWRTQVLEVTITGRPKAFSSSAASSGGLLGSTMRMARVLVGDPGGAQTEMALPYDSRYELIQPGEPAELVVLASDTSFKEFKAVKDVFLPDSGLWVSEYPHADRAQFIDVSLAIEREAAEAAAGGPAAQPAQQQQYGSGYDSGYYGSPPPPSQQQQQPPPQYWDGDGGGNGGFDAYDVPPPRY